MSFNGPVQYSMTWNESKQTLSGVVETAGSRSRVLNRLESEDRHVMEFIMQMPDGSEHESMRLVHSRAG